MQRFLLFALPALMALGCKDPPPILRAKQVTSVHELIGGPLAHGQVGDYVIENDQVRFVVTGAHHSWGPGLFGGTVVDADLHRAEPEMRNGHGNDQFAELFPTANLLVPDPTATQITVTRDGSDGQAAEIRVLGRGLFYLEALSVIDAKGAYQTFLDSPKVGIQTAYDFDTTYTLRPGVRYLEIETTIRRPDDAVPGVPPGSKDPPPCEHALDGCTLTCERGFRTDPITTCLKCECDDATPRPLDLFTEPVPLLGSILGDILARNYDKPDSKRAGVVGGDFLFFGGKTDIFAPGLGFDEKGKVFDNLFRGVDTITSPLTFDWVASVGEDVSYAFFTKREDTPLTCRHRVVLTKLTDPTKRQALRDLLVSDFAFDTERAAQAVIDLAEQQIPLPVLASVEPADLDAKVSDVTAKLGAIARVGTELDGACRPPKLLVPLFTSSATMVASAGLQCLQNDASDDTTCDERRSFRFKRYLAVGEGDVSTAASAVYAARGIDHGDVRGVVFQGGTGSAVRRADVFALRDPYPTQPLGAYADVVAKNLDDIGNNGLESHTRADVGRDPRRTGEFRLTLPAGSWVLVARSPDGVIGIPERVTVAAGGLTVANPVVNAPATLVYRVLENGGGPMPSKITLQALDAEQRALHGDGKRGVELGTGRLDDGIYRIVYSGSGEGSETLEAGAYRVTTSRGFEYSIDRRVLVLEPGKTTRLDAVLTHEVDTTGYISGDFHLHAEPSFDSGMDLESRVLTNVVEGVELLSSSDHDAVTDYKPVMMRLGLDKYATTQVGEEVSTLEIGHFLGFPLAFDHTKAPVHDAVDWVCKTPDQIMKSIRARGEWGPGSALVTVAHPRDGFLGYFDQFGLVPWTAERGDAGLESGNTLFKTLSCDFDAIELFNGKRFELIRTPTVSEVNDGQRCLDEVNAAVTAADVAAVCPWLSAPAECAAGGKNARGEPCAWSETLKAGLAACLPEDTITVCKDKARNAVTTLIVRRMLQRTPEEQAAWANATDAQKSEKTAKCDPAVLKQIVANTTTLSPEEELAPCSQQQGVADDWFQLLNHGFAPTAMGNSDSHGDELEPGIPRNWIASSTDDASRIDRREIADNIKKGKVLPSSGPFVRASIRGKTYGETVGDLPADASVELHLHIETPSWFGVSRIEIYRNGELLQVIDVDKPASAIVDYDGKVDLGRPAEDSWYVVAAMGLRDEDFMQPVYITIPLGELTLAKITTLAFGHLGLVGQIIGTVSQIPDFFPSVPYAMTNPIYVDVDGGGYAAKAGPPPFCPRACTPVEGEPARSDCAGEAEVCHPNSEVGVAGEGGTCGWPIPGSCESPVGTLQAPLFSSEKLKNPLKGLEAGKPNRALQHSVGRQLWNAFVHGMHGPPGAK